MEIWKPFPGYENYEVSSLGKIRRGTRVLKPQIHNDGREFVQFSVGGKRINMKIHRAVGETFLPNPELLPTIDHINRNYLDNRLENLRWCSYSNQMINRDYSNASGQRNIRVSKYGKYEVRIQRLEKVVYYGTFETMEEAIKMRDEFLTRN